jgi:hypothetical protein
MVGRLCIQTSLPYISLYTIYTPCLFHYVNWSNKVDLYCMAILNTPALCISLTQCKCVLVVCQYSDLTTYIGYLVVFCYNVRLK